MLSIPGLYLSCLGPEWKWRGKSKAGLVPLGGIAKLGRDQPEACRIFTKEVLSVFSFCASVHFMGFITDLSSSNVCMNKWTRA